MCFPKILKQMCFNMNWLVEASASDRSENEFEETERKTFQLTGNFGSGPPSTVAQLLSNILASVRLANELLYKNEVLRLINYADACH